MPYDSSRSTETEPVETEPVETEPEPVSAERWGGGRREEEEGKGGAEAQGNESPQWMLPGANQDPPRLHRQGSGPEGGLEEGTGLGLWIGCVVLQGTLGTGLGSARAFTS